MINLNEKYPEPEEFVIIKVSKVLPYGAFAVLVEYPELTGFIHISQVASSWVKNIRNHVKEKQIRVAQVLSVDPSKKQAELSLTKVSQVQQKQKLEEWKQNKRAVKLLEFLAKQQKTGFKKIWKEVGIPLEKKYGSIMDAFRLIVLNNENVSNTIPVKWVKPLEKLVKENIKVKSKKVKGEMTISSNTGNGVKTIKNVLQKALETKGRNIKIWYNGGGKYEIESRAQTYKTAEKQMLEAVSFIETELKKEKAVFSFEKKGK